MWFCFCLFRIPLNHREWEALLSPSWLLPCRNLGAHLPIFQEKLDIYICARSPIFRYWCIWKVKSTHCAHQAPWLPVGDFCFHVYWGSFQHCSCRGPRQVVVLMSALLSNRCKPGLNTCPWIPHAFCLFHSESFSLFFWEAWKSGSGRGNLFCLFVFNIVNGVRETGDG